MVDKKISDDSGATSLFGAVIPIVQDGANRKAAATLFGGLSVEYFGALGDGSTDDSVAFDLMKSTLGYIRLRPNTTYRVKDITLSGKKLFGQGARLKAASGAKWIVRATGYRPAIDNVEFEDDDGYTLRATTLAAGASTSDTTISVASATGLEIGQFIAFRLTNDTYHGTFITGISGTTITLQKALPSGASSGAPVAASWGMLHVYGATRGSFSRLFWVNGQVCLVLDRDGSSNACVRHVFADLNMSGFRYGGLIEGRDVADCSFNNVMIRGGWTEVNNQLGTGAKVNFDISQPIFLKRDVSVYVGGVLKALTTDYTVPSRFRVTMVSAPSNGVAVQIQNFTDAWFGHFNDQTGWSSIRGGCQYFDVNVLDCYFGRFLRKKELATFIGCITDTCEVGEYIRESTEIQYTSPFIGYNSTGVDIGESSTVQMDGRINNTQPSASDLVSGAVGALWQNASGCTLQLNVAGLTAGTALTRTGSGTFSFKGATEMHLGTSATIAAGSSSVYLGPAGNNSGGAPFVVAQSCKAIAMYMQSGSAPGAAQTYTYELYKNGVLSALACSHTGAATFSSSDTDNGISCSPGDNLGVRVTTSAGAAVGEHRGVILLA